MRQQHQQRYFIIFSFFSLGLAMQQMIDVQREIQCQQINTVMYILHDDLLRISCLFITRLFIFLYSWKPSMWISSFRLNPTLKRTLKLYRYKVLLGWHLIKLMSNSCSLVGIFISVISILVLLPHRKLFINDIWRAFDLFLTLIYLWCCITKVGKWFIATICKKKKKN